MTAEDKMIIKRFEELSRRSENRGIWVYSEFLSLAEQSVLENLCLFNSNLDGGHELAERKLAVFGKLEELGYEATAPIVCLKIEAVQAKFSDDLSHRDFLGAIMNLGIRRELIGDIVIHDKIGYVFCLESIAEYIISELDRVRHTTVKISYSEALPTDIEEKSEIVSATVASLRLDAMIAAPYKLSRTEAKAQIENGKVYINSKICENPATEIKENDLISVRGKGRFKLENIGDENKKGRLRVKLKVY